MAIDLNTSMSQEQASFALLIEKKAPYLLHLWNFNTREFKPKEVEKYLSVASHGECIMARFFLSIWCHENRFNFDIIEAAKVLDPQHLKIITNWLTNPIWP